MKKISQLLLLLISAYIILSRRGVEKPEEESTSLD